MSRRDWDAIYNAHMEARVEDRVLYPANATFSHTVSRDRWNPDHPAHKDKWDRATWTEGTYTVIIDRNEIHALQFMVGVNSKHSLWGRDGRYLLGMANHSRCPREVSETIMGDIMEGEAGSVLTFIARKTDLLLDRPPAGTPLNRWWLGHDGMDEWSPLNVNPALGKRHRTYMSFQDTIHRVAQYIDKLDEVADVDWYDLGVLRRKGG